MRVILLLLLCVIVSCQKAQSGEEESVNGPSVMIMSFNLRGANNEEENDFDRWENRRDACCEMIRNVRPMMFGAQECEQEQRDYLKTRCKDYDVVGLGRDEDGKGAQTPIFYLRDSVSVLESGTFWLSDTPDVPSRFSGASVNRIATWIKTKHLKTGLVFYIINTHTTSSKDQTDVREAQISVIMDFVKKNCEDYPVVMTGDWNQGDDHPMFDQVYELFKNARYTATVSDRGTTWNGFDGSSTGKLDHIFYRGFASCSKFAVERRAWNGHVYISDHYPISAILHFSKYNN